MRPWKTWGCTSMIATKAKALFWLSVIWMAMRVYPAFMGWSSIGTEVWQAHKLLDYGFQRLHGGALRWDAWTGTVAHPEHYIYTHHPYPIYWFCAVLYYFFGITGIAVVMFLLKYAALVLSFLVLDRYFSRSSAFWASVLYAVAPCSILLDGNSNSVVVASSLWPIAVALILFRFRRKAAASRGDLLLAGATTFLAGQVSWFALSLAPSLAAINSRLTSLRPRGIREVLRHPVSLAFVVGGVLSFLVFLGQVAFYEPDLLDLSHYLLARAGGSGGALSRWHLLGLVPLRVILFSGVTLGFTALVGCVGFARDAGFRNDLVAGAVLYFIAFAAMVFVLPQFFYTENHIYAWLVFPGAVLAAMLFERSGRTFRNLIVLSGLLGIVLALMRASVPEVSPMSRFMGQTFAAHSRKTDFIFTNIKPPGPPYKSSDVCALGATPMVADRLIVFGVSDPAQLHVAADLVDEATRFEYWNLRSLGVGPALEAELGSRAKLVETIPITFPDRTESLAEKLRSFFWYSVMKKGRPVEGNSALSDYIDIYQVDRPAVSLP